MTFRGVCTFSLTMLLLGGCGGLLETTIPAPQAYVLRLAPRAAASPSGTLYGTVMLQRPEAGPGLDSDRIVLLRSDSRFDFYAASLWAAPAPDMIASFIADGLRASGSFSAVFDDTAPYAPRYNLRCTLRRFESDYTKGGSAPTVSTGLPASVVRTAP